MHRAKRCVSEDEHNGTNTLRDKNYQATSQKSKQKKRSNMNISLTAYSWQNACNLFFPKAET